jgi:hypothetical protein
VNTPVPLPSELRACLRILGWLNSDGAAYRSGQQNGQAQVATAQMQNAVSMITDADLASIIKSAPQSGNLGNKWIFCSRGYGDDVVVVPAVTARWDFTRTNPHLQLRVMFGSVSTDGSGAYSLVSYAYRFETADVGQAHDYHHAQPTLGDRRGGPPLPGVPTVMNEATPAFPLDASGPVGITMCVVRAIYAAKGFRKLMRDADMKRMLTPYLRQMPAFDGR